MQTILDYFFSKGFISSNHLQDPVPFAEAIAKWQATQFKNKQDIDGILGPASCKIIEAITLHTSTPQQERLRNGNR